MHIQEKSLPSRKTSQQQKMNMYIWSRTKNVLYSFNYLKNIYISLYQNITLMNSHNVEILAFLLKLTKKRPEIKKHFRSFVCTQEKRSVRMVF